MEEKKTEHEEQGSMDPTWAEMPEEDWPVKAKELAQLFGLSERRIQLLTKDGVLVAKKLPKIRGRRYMCKETVRGYITYLSDKIKGKAVSNDEAQLKRRKLQAEAELKESQKELHELKMEISRGKYVAVTEVELDYKKFLTVFRKFTDSIPARVAMTIGGRLEPLEVRKIEKELVEEINGMLRNFTVAAIEQTKGKNE